MLVVIKEPRKKPIKKDITGGLDDYQSIVGGYIQVLNPLPDESILLICNEEGKLLGLEPNLDLGYDVVMGTVLFAKFDGGEDIVGLSETEADKLVKLLSGN